MTIEEALRGAIEHHQAGRLADAEAGYRRILAQQPEHVDALRLLGMIATQCGNPAAGIALIELALRVAPHVREVTLGLADAWAAQANQLAQRGEMEKAIAAYRRAVELVPDYVEAHSNLSDVLRVAGRFDEALASAAEALRLRPGSAAALNNEGNALLYLGRREEALAAYESAVRADPQSASAHANRGNALMALGRHDEALAAYEAAARIAPRSPQVLSNLAVALRDSDRLDEALAAQRQAVEAEPRLAESHVNLGNILRDTGEIEPAIDAYRTAVRLRPNFAAGWSNLLYALAFDPRMTGAQILREHETWGKMFPQPQSHQTTPRPKDGRLRIGYVSPDLREHPVGRFMLPLLAHHNRANFEISCYADNARDDAISARLRPLVDHWHDTFSLSDDQLAELIRQGAIDVLVDLAVHSSNNRLHVFAARPAPVQVTYLGYPGTSGLPAMDFRLTDPFLDPPGSASLYTERSVHLRTTYWCYQPPDDAPAVGELPMRSSGHVTFGCLNSFAKVSAAALEAWAQLMSAIPRSRLILHTGAGVHRQRVIDLFARHNISAERIEFLGRAGRADYFTAYHRIDIALDPFPCSGATTTCDALWMGVPVVTLAGDLAMRRSSASLLSLAGLPDLVTTNIDAYLAAATALANDPARLTDLRATLRERMRASPIMDAPAFVRDLERCYREMCDTGRAHPPASP